MYIFCNIGIILSPLPLHTRKDITEWVFTSCDMGINTIFSPSGYQEEYHTGCTVSAILGVISTSQTWNMKKNITGWMFTPCRIGSNISLSSPWILGTISQAGCTPPALRGVISSSPFQDIKNNITGQGNTACDTGIVIILSPSGY